MKILPKEERMQSGRHREIGSQPENAVVGGNGEAGNDALLFGLAPWPG